MQEIKIWWEGPFSIDDIVEDKIDKKNYDNTADRKGLYQIYGFHPLYGNDVLLYIGRTKDKHGFKNRLKNRWQINYNLDSENVKIYLGCIMEDAKVISEKDELDSIEKAEVLLINAIMPALNSSNIQSVGEKYATKKYTVKNFGNFRSLFPVLETKYYWRDFSNREITEKLARQYGAKASESEKEDYYGFFLEGKKIFFGVDYECWRKKYPLIIGVEKDTVDDPEVLKESYGKILDCEDDYYNFKIDDDLSRENIYNIAKKKIEDMKKFVEKRA